MATSDSNEKTKTKKKDLLDKLTVDIIKKKFNYEPPYLPEQILELESCKVKIYST